MLAAVSVEEALVIVALILFIICALLFILGRR
jgi:hypothetical protein